MSVRRAAKQGLRQGKWGFPVTKCPYAPGDRSPEAVAWRKGWTLGNTAFRQDARKHGVQTADGGTVNPDHVHVGWEINGDFPALLTHMEMQHADAVLDAFTIEQLPAVLERAHLVDHLPLVECPCCGAMVRPVPIDVSTYAGGRTLVAGRPDCPCPDPKET